MESGSVAVGGQAVGEQAKEQAGEQVKELPKATMSSAHFLRRIVQYIIDMYDMSTVRLCYTGPIPCCTRCASGCKEVKSLHPSCTMHHH